MARCGKLWAVAGLCFFMAGGPACASALEREPETPAESVDSSYVPRPQVPAPVASSPETAVKTGPAAGEAKPKEGVKMPRVPEAVVALIFGLLGLLVVARRSSR
jgi:hypothetical protein